MALQTSGAISISNIKAELSSSSNSLRALSSAAGKSTPDAMSEFYGYSAYAPPTLSGSGWSVTGSGTVASPWIVTVTGYTYYQSIDETFYVDLYEAIGYGPTWTINQTGNYNVYFDFISASLSGIRGDGNDAAQFYVEYRSFGINSAASGAGFNEVAWNNLVNGYDESGGRNISLQSGWIGRPWLYARQYWDPITVNNIKFSLAFELL